MIRQDFPASENRDEKPPRKGSSWRSISKPPADEIIVDIWMNIHPSPRSMGIGDQFCVTNAWRRDSKWFHTYRGAEAELYTDYVTHWRPVVIEPDGEADAPANSVLSSTEEG